MICATAVPITASAITEPLSFQPGTLVRQLQEPQRDQDEQTAEHRARREHEPAGAARSAAGPRGCRPRTRPTRPRPRASRRRPTSRPSGCTPASTPTPSEPDEEADQPQPVHALARLASGSPAARRRSASRRWRSRPRPSRCALAPGDQRERDRAVYDPEREAFPAEAAHVGDGRVPAALQRRARPAAARPASSEPEHDHRRRLEGAVGDLDEHVGRTPERGQQADVDHVRARHAPEATVPAACSWGRWYLH